MKYSVTCLGPCPLNSWWNSTQFLCKALVCRSYRTKVGNLQKFRTVFHTKMKKNIPDMWMTGVMCLGPCSLNSWWNSTPFLCKALVRVRNFQKIRTVFYTEMKKTCRTRDTCLGPCPLDSWWNSDHFTCVTLYCSSIQSKVSKKRDTWHVTRDGHVTRV